MTPTSSQRAASAQDSETKVRPILMSAPMVRAILSGSKTQTRRIVKPQPGDDLKPGVLPMPEGAYAKQEPMHPGLWYVRHDKAVFREGDPPCAVEYWRERCPYGRPGDKLWVKETCQAWAEYDGTKPSDIPHDPRAILYVAGRDTSMHWDAKKRPSIFMPRWASRITLEIKAVRVERLQDISEADAEAEGCPAYTEYVTQPGDTHLMMPEKDVSAIEHYRQVWERINGVGSWESNPWVWIVDFAPIPHTEGDR